MSKLNVSPASGAATKLPSVVGPEPEIAVLLSTYQKPWHLERVLTSVAAQKGVEGRFEVVVSDDGSTDETPRIVDRFARSVPFRVSFTTHSHETFQLARCRNEGVAASRAPYLLFTDGDCVLPADHVAEHLKRRRPGWVMAGDCCRLDQSVTARLDDEVIRGGRYLGWVARSQLRTLFLRDLKARFYGLTGHPTKPKMLGGSAAMWRRDFERVNGYDENFEGWGCEDDDLRLRLRRAGVRVASILRWTRTYHLWHPPDVTSTGKWRSGRNVKYFSRRCRLTRCMNGLVKRSLDDLAAGVVGSPSKPSRAAALLRSCPLRLAETDSPEVELLFLPGRGRFSGRADCNVLVVLEDSPQAARMARKAHLVVADRPYVGAEDHVPLAELDRALRGLGQSAERLPDGQRGRSAA